MKDVRVLNEVIDSSWLSEDDEHDYKIQYEATLEICDGDGDFIDLTATSWIDLIARIQAISERIVVTGVSINSKLI